MQIKGIQIEKISLIEYNASCYVNFQLGRDSENKSILLKGTGKTSLAALLDLLESIKNFCNHYGVKYE